jgi:hypothetical protein
MAPAQQELLDETVLVIPAVSAAIAALLSVEVSAKQHEAGQVAMEQTLPRVRAAPIII